MGVLMYNPNMCIQKVRERLEKNQCLLSLKIKIIPYKCNVTVIPTWSLHFYLISPTPI